jgi:PhzF family phenazine biosynthesis protein
MLAKTDEKLSARLQEHPVQLTQETKAGIMTIVLSLEDGEPKITMRQRAPQFAAANADTSAIARALNIKEEELDGRFVPALANTGNWHLIVAVNAKATLDSIKYDTNALSAILTEAKAATAHVFYSDAVIYFARNFCPTIGIAEDPATGAAAGAFVAYLKNFKYLQQRDISIIQGEAMGRPSKILASIDAENNVEVSGRATLSFTLSD